MAKFWQFLVDEANKGNIKLEIEMNGITYDKNFGYNPITNTLVADSTDNLKQEFGCDCNVIIQYVNNKQISMKIKLQ